MIITFSLLFSSFFGHSQELNADFSAEFTSGCVPLSVNFVDLSSPNSDLTYNWDFGNGIFSTLENPSTIYIQPGSYTVRLIVSNGIQTDTIIKDNYIQIFGNPTADFELVDPSNGCVPYSANFLDKSTSPSDSINYWLWDFGDGHYSELQNPNNIFQNKGDFIVSLYIEDVNGCSSVATLENAISTHKPTADFSADITFSCDEILTTTFTNLSYGDNLTNYNWSFGDSSFSSSNNPIHNYSSVGDFDVTLIVTDAYNCKDTLQKNNYITNQHTTAKAKIDKYNFCKEEKIKFNNYSLNATDYLWNFNNEHTSTGISPEQSFSSDGKKTVKLVTSNEYGCKDSSLIFLYIIPIEANFEIEKDYSCKIPDTIQYTNLSTNAIEYIWHFGNGNISYDENPANIIENSGFYSDTLYAIGKNGCTDKFVLDSGLTILTPKAYFTPNNLSDPYSLMGCVPNIVNFEDASIYNKNNRDSIIDWFWSFGDGTTSNEPSPSHTYTSLDTFLISLQITTALGCTSMAGAWASTGTKQRADFTSNCPDTICANMPIDFVNLSQDDALVNLWYWKFGDSTYSLLENPTHLFLDTGYMDLKLTVYNNGCPDDTIVHNYVYVQGSYHKIIPQYICETPYSPILTSNLLGGTSFIWDFGDGSEKDSINLNPIHTFPDRGEYNVSLKSFNNNSGCDYISSEIINISKAEASFFASQDKICTNSTVIFNSATSIDNSTFVYEGKNCNYLWDFDDGTPIVGTQDTIISHTFTQEGDFNVKLIIKNKNKCYDSISMIIQVHKPHIEFLSNENIGCSPLAIQFDNISTSYFPISKYFWEFGDDSTSTEENPLHIYNKTDEYDIILTLIDEQNCVASDTFVNYIESHKPIPDFSVSKRNLCTGDSVVFNFINQKDSISSILWDFGDGNTSNEISPTHFYNDSGHFDVSLTLIDLFLCDTTKTINNYISVQKTPIASFTADTTNSSCYPLLVQFHDNTNFSDNYSRVWQLNDNVSSSLENPSYSYMYPGNYNVTLTVTSSNGCSSSITENNFISIQGPYCELQIEDTICKRLNYDYSISNTQNIYDIQWFFGEGSTAYDSTASFAYQNAGTFYPVVLLRSDNINTCNKFFFDSIYVRDINAGFITDNGTAGCVPFEFILTDTTANTDYRSWDFDDELSDITQTAYHVYNEAGTYSLTLYETDIFGCQDTVTKTFISHPLPEINIIQDTFICKGDEIQLWANGAETYSWYPVDFLYNQNSDKPTTNTTENKQYSVAGVDSNGCTNYASTNITVVQKPKFNIYDTTIVVGDTIFFDNSYNDIENYLWTPSIGLDCDTCSHIAISPLTQTEYSLTIQDTAGCFELSKCFMIDVYLKYSIDVPTAFSPNGDGTNDRIFVDGWGIKNLIYFNIYNRFGELVYSSTDLYEGWDGTYKGENQPVETYRYNAAVMTYDGNILKKTGTIKLIH